MAARIDLGYLVTSGTRYPKASWWHEVRVSYVRVTLAAGWQQEGSDLRMPYVDMWTHDHLTT